MLTGDDPEKLARNTRIAMRSGRPIATASMNLDHLAKKDET